jgi:hypothetical protein
MPIEESALYIFNRGALDRRALPHLDSKRLALGVETQVNWMSHVIGHMTLRPGLEMIGEIAGNPTLPSS